MDSIISVLQSVWRYLLLIRITDVLDVAIMSFAIYKVLSLVRSTRAENILKGVVFFILALWLSSLMNLRGINYILSYVVEWGVLALFILCYHKLFAITFDEVFARATGVHTQAYKTLLAILTAVTIVLGMKLMGAIMISGLVVFPAMSAMRLCKSFRGVVLCSGGLAVVCFVAGFFTACRLSWQTGPTVIAVHTLVFVLVSAGSALATSRLLRRKKA